MYGETVISLSGVVIDEEIIDGAAEEALKEIMSELPEKAQTYDMVLYTLRRAKEILKMSKVQL